MKHLQIYESWKLFKKRFILDAEICLDAGKF